MKENLFQAKVCSPEQSIMHIVLVRFGIHFYVSALPFSAVNLIAIISLRNILF